MKTIMKLSIVILMVFSTTMLFSQVLVSDEEAPDVIDNNAMFEVRSTTPNSPLGMLIPRVNLSTDVNGDVYLENMEEPTDGLLIFNLGESVERGLWYYDGAENVNKWVLYSRQGSVYSLSADNYGEMYEDPNSSVTYELEDAGVYYPWISSLEGEVGSFFTYHSGYDLPDGGTGDVLFVDGGGIYQVTITGTIKTLTSGNTLTGKLFVNGNEINKIQFSFHFQTSNDITSLSTSGLIDLNTGEVVSFRFMSEDGNDAIDVKSFNLTLAKISGVPPAPPITN